MRLPDTLKGLRVTGLLEGISFLVLLTIAMPMKYLVGKPQMVQVVGMAHGLLFVLYILLTVAAKLRYPWTWRTMLLLWVASVVPFGTFYADYKILRNQGRGNRLT